MDRIIDRQNYRKSCRFPRETRQGLLDGILIFSDNGKLGIKESAEVAPVF